jgi:2-polyprenyl-3-methyl-5-hydroxy-6-metoxy-1,4-benzoquinol methylase
MNCPHSAHTAPLRNCFPHGAIDFRQCPECGLLFRDTFPTPSELEQIYDDAFSNSNVAQLVTDQESGEFALHSYADYICRKFLRPGVRVLDFGAATGVMVEALRTKGIQADGIEYSKKAREYAQSYRKLQLLRSLDDINDQSYDFVTMIEVIEHLVDLTKTLSSIRRVMRPRGSLFITTPNSRGLRARLEGGKWREARKQYHLFLFDRQSLAFHLTQNGFSRCRIERFSPVQKNGIAAAIYARATQSVNLSGTLCMVARKC